MWICCIESKYNTKRFDFSICLLWFSAYWGKYARYIFSITKLTYLIQSLHQNQKTADTGYLLFYNSSDTQDQVNFAMEWINSIETAILRKRTSNDSAIIKVNSQPYPHNKLRMSGYDVVAANGLSHYKKIFFSINNFRKKVDCGFSFQCVSFFSLFWQKLYSKKKPNSDLEWKQWDLNHPFIAVIFC